MKKSTIELTNIARYKMKTKKYNKPLRTKGCFSEKKIKTLEPFFASAIEWNFRRTT